MENRIVEECDGIEAVHIGLALPNIESSFESKGGKDGIDVSFDSVMNFGKKRDHWEIRGMQNTPNGVIPIERSSRSLKYRDDMDEILPITSVGSDTTETEEFLAGNVNLLCGQFLRKKEETVSEDSLNEEKPSRFLPKKLPTKTSDSIVNDLLAKAMEGNLNTIYPRCISFTLWGTDNMNTFGKSIAQIFALIGVRLVKEFIDDDGENEIELIPVEKLGRPRIDVVVCCSGVFRDLFRDQMSLMDRAIKLAASAEEPLEQNFIRKHSIVLSNQFHSSLSFAATRMFSNAPGSYGANVRDTVNHENWNWDERELREEYLARKGYSFHAEKPSVMVSNARLFKAVLRNVDVTFQNLDLAGISITDVGHYFDADPTKVVQNLRGSRLKPMNIIADPVGTSNSESSRMYMLSEIVSLDAESKLLNRKFHRDVGVKEINERLRNTLGWAITSGEVENGIFEKANDLFFGDFKTQQRLKDDDSISFQKLIETFLDANTHGYWETSQERIQILRDLRDCLSLLSGT